MALPNHPLPPELTPLLRRGMTAITFFGFLSFLSSLGLLVYLGHRIAARIRKGHNQSQLLLLVFNLMLADCQLGLAFVIEAHWLDINMVVSGTTTCVVQGWFKSIGNISAGLFCLAIGLYTLVYITYNYQLPPFMIYVAIGFIWTIVFLFATVNLSIHSDDWFASQGSYVR